MRILKFLPFFENISENPIADIQEYNQKMKNAFFDKLFFLGKIKFDALVDFGCADGSLLEKISKYSKADLFGFDVEPHAVNLSKNRLGNKATVLDNWHEIIGQVNEYHSPAILLSSVIHEVYSYDKYVNYFWNDCVFNDKFKYIIIRDMIPSGDIDDVHNFSEDVRKVKSKVNNKYLNDFEKIWGKMEDSYRQFTHFLLKYKYIHNWNREVKENYLPLTISELKEKIPSGYEIVYESNFILPYLQQEVSRDFGIKFRQPTHTKMIIKNNNFK